MAKRRTTQEWYSLDRILNYNIQTMLTIGQRSNGKSYSVKKEIVDMLASENGKFIYLRREKEYIKRSKIWDLFSDIDDYCIEKLGSTISYDAEKGFYIIDGDGNIKVVGYALCVQNSLDYKGVIYTNIKIIMFDEFMDYSYFNDETTRYIQLLSTITRDAVIKNYKCKLHLLANTVNKYNPYLDLYKFDMKKMRQGDIAVVHHRNGVSAVLEYCKTKVDIDGVIPKHPFVGFDDNETVTMVMHGDWEVKDYEIKNIDGIGWDYKKRRRIPLYITANKRVYELSLSITKIPIAFVRELNTQFGQVHKDIRYNISLDRYLILTNVNGFVPMLQCINDFIDDSTLNEMRIFQKCVESGRIIFDNLLTGTEFTTIYNKIKGGV